MTRKLVLALCVAAPLVLAVAIGAFVLASDNDSDNPKTVSPADSAAKRQQDKREAWMLRDHPPPSVGLKRLAADDGGIWVGEAAGRRVLLYLGAPSKFEDSYLAVLWGADDRKVQFYEVDEIQVWPNGEFVIHIAGVEGEANAHPLLASGQYADGSLRVDEFVPDAQELLPDGITLERATDGVRREAERLRVEFRKLEADPYGR